MKESYGEGIATHAGSESCGHPGEGSAEASRGVRAGRVYRPERHFLRGADAVRRSGGPCRPAGRVLDQARHFRSRDSNSSPLGDPMRHQLRELSTVPKVDDVDDVDAQRRRPAGNAAGIVEGDHDKGVHPDRSACSSSGRETPHRGPSCAVCQSCAGRSRDHSYDPLRALSSMTAAWWRR